MLTPSGVRLWHTVLRNRVSDDLKGFKAVEGSVVQCFVDLGQLSSCGAVFAVVGAVGDVGAWLPSVHMHTTLCA
eukprot:4776041-Amphidinium_carterae.2